VWLTVSEPARPDNGVTVYQLPFAPAGTDLLDRVLAAHTQRGLVVTAPAGVRADVLDATGTVLESLPLVEGGGTGALRDPAASATVRVVDAAGTVVTEAPISALD
jgi:hypothetical protein